MMLSFIIPNHNGRSTLSKALESISKAARRYKHEIIVIDDHSADGSQNLGKNLSRVIALNKKTGAAAARNEGIKAAKGEILIFLDNDAWLQDSSVSEMLAALGKETDIVFPKVTFESGAVFYPLLPAEKEYPHISCCFLIKKKSFGKLDEQFDENYGTYLEDFDFFIRCKLACLNAKYAENSQIVHADKSARDYSRRYFLEVRNLVYGILKFGRIAGSAKMQNPFTFASVIKAFYCGIINFAWFDWQAYDRKSKKRVKKSTIQKNAFKNPAIFIRGILCGLSMSVKAKEKQKTLRKLYNLS